MAYNCKIVPEYKIRGVIVPDHHRFQDNLSRECQNYIWKEAREQLLCQFNDKIYELICMV